LELHSFLISIACLPSPRPPLFLLPYYCALIRPRGEEIWSFPLLFFHSLAVLSSDLSIYCWSRHLFCLNSFFFSFLYRALDLGQIFPISLWFIQALH
jgi:hypothetical protein